jgi:hypothetical protein
METQFVTLQVPLQASPGETRQTIEIALAEQGIPLRWAITAMDLTQQLVQVEAIITTNARH